MINLKLPQAFSPGQVIFSSYFACIRNEYLRARLQGFVFLPVDIPCFSFVRLASRIYLFDAYKAKITSGISYHFNH